jgi:hypothetical protein
VEALDLAGRDPEVTKIILSILPRKWDLRFTSNYISMRVPWLSSRQVAAYIKRNLELKYVESRKILCESTRLKIYRIKPDANIDRIIGLED